MGLHTYPEYLIHGGTTDNDRIIRFNLFLSQLEHREKPDVLLIQLPGGLLRFNDAILNGFGIVPYFIAQAASCDYFICCSINDCFNQAFWKSISDDFKYRYGHEIDCVHLSNVSVSMMESMETKHLEYYRTPPEKICLDEQRAQNSRDIPVDDLLDEPAFARLMDDISGKCMLC